MQDASPRIFRSLELEAGRDGFDMVVRAAVADYSALRRPTEAQAVRLGRLVEPVWSRLGADTRRTVAASLASCPLVPREIVERLIASPLEIAAPFLATSDSLTPDDLAALEIAGDARMVRLLRLRASARAAMARPVDPPSAIEPEREPAAPVAEAAPAAPAPELSVDGEAPAESAAIADVRETLRRLARPGAAAPAPAPVRRGSARPEIAELKALAAQGDAEGVFAALGAWAQLSPSAAASLGEDASGHALAMALKAAGAGKADAMTIIMLVTPAVGLDLQAFETMAALYASLNEEECRRRLAPAAEPRARRVVAVPSLALRAEDLRPVDRVPVRRPRFGRRREAPPSSRETG